MRNLILILTPLLLLGVFCSMQKEQKPIVIKEKIINCDSTEIEYYCKLNNYKLIWEK
jgi:hypothetical protein